MRAAQFGRTECVKVLLRNGARCDLRNADGKTAADMATEAGHHDLAKHIAFLSCLNFGLSILLKKYNPPPTQIFRY